jgi:hypothetical protein
MADAYSNDLFDDALPDVAGLCAELSALEKRRRIIWELRSAVGIGYLG